MVRLLFAAVCAASLLATPTLAPDAKAQTDKAVVKPEKPPLTPNQIAARKRQKQCAAEWKEAKAAGKIETGTTWPKYWSACNTRLKAGG